MDQKNLADLYNLPPIPWSRALESLESDQREKDTNFLATTQPDGRPHLTGVGAMWDGGKIYFVSGAGTRKSQNLAQNPNCSISMSIAKDVATLVSGVAGVAAGVTGSAVGAAEEATDAALAAKSEALRPNLPGESIRTFDMNEFEPFNGVPPPMDNPGGPPQRTTRRPRRFPATMRRRSMLPSNPPPSRSSSRWPHRTRTRTSTRRRRTSG